MLIAFITAGIVLIAFYTTAAPRYAGKALILDKKAHPLKAFYPLGFLLLELCRWNFLTGYDRWLLMRLTELKGSKDPREELRLYWANKIAVVCIALLSVLFIGVFTYADEAYILFSLAVVAGSAVFPDKELDRQVKKRRRLIQLDFPGFIIKLTLLINAGMTVFRAWERAAGDGNAEKPLYKELQASVRDVKGGCPEYKAYEYFANRCKVPEVTRAVSVIVQNLRKGNSELVSILRFLSAECWELRKSSAKKLGEEAATRMIIPLMLMFIAILLMVATPAVLALRGI